MMKQKFKNVKRNKIKCFDCESNTGPSDLQSDALPTELSKHLLERADILRNL